MADVHAKKSLGQNFLTDAFYLGRIADAIGGASGEQLVEIGPGSGRLTEKLLATGAHVTAIELDERCIPLLHTLSEKYENRLQVIHGDALAVAFDDTLCPKGTRLVGNLPYNVGTVIVTKALESGHFGPMTFLLQKEVVARICAEPDTADWGRLGIFCQWLADCNALFDVPPGAFTPAPKVTSAVVGLVPLAAPRYPVPAKKLEALTRQAFGQRRKMLRASLKGLLTAEQIQAAGLDPQARPEQLSLEQLVHLASQLT